MMNIGKQRERATIARYELRSSEPGIELAGWRQAVREAVGPAGNIIASVRGPVRFVHFDTKDPLRVRQHVRTRLGTENFTLRVARRMPGPQDY